MADFEYLDDANARADRLRLEQDVYQNMYADDLRGHRGTDVSGVELVKIEDSRTSCVEQNLKELVYAGYVGARLWNECTITASVATPDQLHFAQLNTIPGNLIERRWWIEYTIVIKISNIPGTRNSCRTFIGDQPPFGFKAFPLHQSTTSAETKFNNRSVMSYPMESLNQRMEYMAQKDLKVSCSCCPHRKNNGSTLGDCNIRKGNAPLNNLDEFNDQDLPNSTVIEIQEVKYTAPEIDEDSNFERDAPFKAYKPVDDDKNNEDATVSIAVDGTADIAGGTLQIVHYRYRWLEKEFAKYISEKYGGALGVGDVMTAKKAFLAEKAISGFMTTNPNNDIAAADVTFKYAQKTLKWFDADFLTSQDLAILVDNESIALDDKGEAKVFWSGARCTKMGDYSLTCKIREPVIADPLDYYSPPDKATTIWGVTSVELKYNFNNKLKNMLMFDRQKLEQSYEWFWAFDTIKRLYTGEEQGIICDSNVDIQFFEKPTLRFNVGLPREKPTISFCCAHKQFQRFEAHLSADMDAANIERSKYINSYQATPIKARSELIPVQFHPNAIYLWVGERSTDRYSSPNRYFHLDSFAKITGVKIQYGNIPNLMSQFKDYEFFTTAQRNGLQDRTFMDWNAGPKSIVVPTDYRGYQNYYGIGGGSLILTPETKYNATTQESDIIGLKYDAVDISDTIMTNRYAGIGSVLKLIPGLDILSDDKNNPIVAGMRATQKNISFEVDFVPLNIHQSINYSLYVMLEYDGVFTINAATNACDLGMIAIDSEAQILASAKVASLSTLWMRGAGQKDLNNYKNFKAMCRGCGFGRGYYGGGGRRGGGGSGGSSSSSSQGRGYSSGGMAPKMSGGKFIDPRDLNGGNFYSQY